MHGPDRARVRQGHRRFGEVIDRELVIAGPAHHVFIGGPELGKVHSFGGFYVWNEKLARAIGFGQVDSEPEIYVVWVQDAGLAIHFGVGNVHGALLVGRLHERKTDQVGERNFAAATRSEERRVGKESGGR